MWWGGCGEGKEKKKQDGIGRETNHKRLLISQNKLRVAGGGMGGIEIWTGWFGYGQQGRYVL